MSIHPSLLASAAAQSAAATPVWQYLVTTLVALLAAGGGVAAVVTIVLRRRLRIATRVHVEPTPLYSVEVRGRRVVLRPTEALKRLRTKESNVAVSPVVLLDITNLGEAAVSINEVRWNFSSRTRPDENAPEPARVVVRYAEGDDHRAAVERAHGLTPAAVEGAFVTYHCPADQAANLVTRLSAEPRVALAFVDVTGAPHSEWTVRQDVDMLLSGNHVHTDAVQHTLEPHNSLTLRYRLGGATNVAGVAEVSVLANSGKLVRVGTVDLELFVPHFVQLTLTDATDGR